MDLSSLARITTRQTAIPGPTNNASGVAGLIELANLSGETQLLGRVERVACGLEEPLILEPSTWEALCIPTRYVLGGLMLS